MLARDNPRLMLPMVVPSPQKCRGNAVSEFSLIFLFLYEIS